jgi:hypothetical protein
MTGRSEVVALARCGVRFEALGRHFGMPPGRAYLVAVGHPADDSDAASDRDSYQVGILRESSTQYLCNPPSVSVVSHPAVHRWMEARALRDLLNPPGPRTREARNHEPHTTVSA